MSTLVRFSPGIAFALLAALGGCTLFVDTGDLADGPARPTDGGVDALAPPDAEADASTQDVVTEDARPPFYPPTATLWPSNGHAYEILTETSGITWQEAKAKAVARGGHLATITSREENVFVWSLVLVQQPSPIVDDRGPWLGGYQDPGIKEENVGWKWVTGEPWASTDWQVGEPNDSVAKEQALGFYGGPGWADYNDSEYRVIISYAVEYE